MRVRVGSLYVYQPVALDIFDGRTQLSKGDVVKVVNLRGCPRANTMGHCHVEAVATVKLTVGMFAGLVCCNSLVTLKDWNAMAEERLRAKQSALRAEVAEFLRWKYLASVEAHAVQPYLAKKNDQEILVFPEGRAL